MESKTRNEPSNNSLRQYSPVKVGGDAYLWHLARRRAAFKGHLAIYLVLSAFFWLLWYVTGGARYTAGTPWPVWPMLGWGIGVFFHYMSAYMAPRSHAVEKEYQKLKQQQINSNQ